MSTDKTQQMRTTNIRPGYRNQLQTTPTIYDIITPDKKQIPSSAGRKQVINYDGRMNPQHLKKETEPHQRIMHRPSLRA